MTSLQRANLPQLFELLLQVLHFPLLLGESRLTVLLLGAQFLDDVAVLKLLLGQLFTYKVKRRQGRHVMIPEQLPP